ncbi:hypothetical protein [Phormidium sp. CCY1219]|uniref:hypothetical protein n=1 Tax=Phormidium sp. CCY1219 TaxID=2886104 RepID=UPI002D1EFE5E|nr:hypothetical protein [Phormidium sp. CCY1219]MEB3831203.1 hypothetical protein [Phormidium sp. CCY1219]
MRDCLGSLDFLSSSYLRERRSPAGVAVQNPQKLPMLRRVSLYQTHWLGSDRLFPQIHPSRSISSQTVKIKVANGFGEQSGLGGQL